MKELTVNQINGLVRKYITEALEIDEVEKILDKGSFKSINQKDHVSIMEMVSDLFKKKLATNDKSFMKDVVDEFLMVQGIKADQKSFEYKMMGREMLKAESHIYDIQRKRQQGDYSDDIIPDFLKPSMK